ncbi:amidase domain-containing protein [Oceanobacillus timonensis]|uniref:amidase domain-containing protein n=1 Tax=Oceanobacillus timonensis TaxID=1926285 RepID=UPI0009BA0A09|nr:amidase domain-containing protein [Oceanobacillus timonensis]
MGDISTYWHRFFHGNKEGQDWWQKKKELCRKREAQLVKIKGKGLILSKQSYDTTNRTEYALHLEYLLKQGDFFYKEEQVIPYQFVKSANGKERHEYIEKPFVEKSRNPFPVFKQGNQKEPYRETEYNRLEAVKYAERWWNSFNPEYLRFEDDCTNYISQCLRAGGGPMWGEPVREQGWWYGSDSWSFSWSVAHSFRWYLSGSERGIRGIEVESPEELNPGDVICYDFDGDGAWNHSTIVVRKDVNNMPLVNAHTDNSRNRYWSYEDSTAWTPEIQYKFFRIEIN